MLKLITSLHEQFVKILHNIQTELQSTILIELIHQLYKQVKELKTHDGEHLTTTQRFVSTS